MKIAPLSTIGRFVASLLICGTAAFAPCGFASSARAQDARPTGGRAAPRPVPGAAAVTRAMPVESVTHHTLDLAGRALKFTASAGAFRIGAPDAPVADIAYTAYALDGATPASRPVTFVFNGGPGASSAWLHLGAVGPWRVAMSGDAALPSAPHVAGPNAETWLDFTDLVFIDPAGTGFSRLLKDDEATRRRVWGVEGDIDMLTEVVRRWLARAHRMASPKYIVGESYGGFRGPRIVRGLELREGIGVAGLILVSPLLDFGQRSGLTDPLTWATRLPSITASARERAGPVTRDSLADVERYAAGEFITDFLRGESDAAALDRIAARVAAFTQLDPALVRARGGRIDWRLVLRRDPGRVGALYDSTVTTADPFPLNPLGAAEDPIADGLRAAMTTAALELYGGRLNWLPDGRYEVLNTNVLRQWDYGRAGRPESLVALRLVLALDPRLRLLVLHGLNDLATPYFLTKLELDQMPAELTLDRVRFLPLPGGHMFYIRDASRQAFREAASKLFQ